MRIALPFLLALLVGCCWPTADGEQRMVEVEATADTYINESDTGSVFCDEGIVIWKASYQSERFNPIIRFDVPALATGETLDSCHVVGEVGPWKASAYFAREVLRAVDYTGTTWDNYKAGSAWQTAGGYGALDVDTSTDWGYGANGHIYEGTSISSVGIPDTSFVYFFLSGEYFSDFIEAREGTTVDLILQGPVITEEPAGSFIFYSLESETEDPAKLVLYINAPLDVSRRRRDMLTEPGL